MAGRRRAFGQAKSLSFSSGVYVALNAQLSEEYIHGGEGRGLVARLSTHASLASSGLAVACVSARTACSTLGSNAPDTPARAMRARRLSSSLPGPSQSGSKIHLCYCNPHWQRTSDSSGLAVFFALSIVHVEGIHLAAFSRLASSAKKRVTSENCTNELRAVYLAGH